jgi:hypothetical protein
VSKCKHQQSHYDFLYIVSKKNSYWVSLFYRNNLLTKVYFSWDPNFLLLCIFFLHCMDLQPYSHNRFSKISRTFFASRNQWIIAVFLQCTLKEKLLFVLINTLLLHISLLALTHPQTELQTKEWIHSLRVGWRNFLSSCAVVSVFWFWQEIGFGFTYLST